MTLRDVYIDAAFFVSILPSLPTNPLIFLRKRIAWAMSSRYDASSYSIRDWKERAE
jgi:hypothetical protein|tara:strand:+ start:71 stop:238 length:168 start_codon:yes stop_codon:yes gene_type:complete